MTPSTSFGRAASRRHPASALFATLAAGLALSLAAPARAEVQIERAFLPHNASPSSFAIGLPGGINVCFDPVRCAVSYAWTGGFLDLSPTRPGAGKFIAPAKLLGPLAYQETGDAPLRRGDPTRPSVVEFTGYRLLPDAIEFRYTIDGIPVREEIRANAAGTALLRRFHIPSGADAKWFHAPAGQPPRELVREPAGNFLMELPLARSTP